MVFRKTRSKYSATASICMILLALFLLTGCPANETEEVSDELATWYEDADGDGYGDVSNSVRNQTAPVGYVSDNSDCDDTDQKINPGANEICGDTVDQDCNGIDLECDIDNETVDNDGDGFSASQGDCNDADNGVHPGASEICGDNIDQDCNGSDLACDVDSRDIDNDNDGFTENQGDCNDGNANQYPGAVEICGDNIDQDCNGSDLACSVDPDDIDNDGDGFTENQGDCNDDNANKYPGAVEICGDGQDQDCNGSDLACSVDPDDIDNDGDGFTENQGDCRDTNPNRYPGAVEICGDNIDQDCNGSDLACDVDPDDIDDDGDGFTENQGDCNDNDDEIHPNALEVCGDGIDNDCSGGDASCSGGGGGTLSCPDCDLCNGQDPCDLPKNTKITVTSSKSPTWKLDFGVGRGDDSPVIVGGGVAHNLRIPSSSSKSIDGPGKDSCCNGIGLDNHEWRWKVRGAPEECDGDPGEVNVVGKGTRADLAMKTIASRYTLVEQTSKKIVFYISGTVRTTLTDAVRQCAELGYDHTYEYADFRRTTTITPDGFTVEMAMDYDGTVGENSMWWTIAQFKNAPAFSQGILPSQVKVTDGSKTVSLAFTPHSALSLPGGITVPYTFIFPLNSPQNHRLYFDIEKYAQNSDGGNPNLYEFWHKDGDGAPSSIGNYSVVYPRWNDTNKRGFRKTTYTFEWRWRFTN
jgi:hypothetical protein